MNVRGRAPTSITRMRINCVLLAVTTFYNSLVYLATGHLHVSAEGLHFINFCSPIFSP